MTKSLIYKLACAKALHILKEKQNKAKDYSKRNGGAKNPEFEERVECWMENVKEIQALIKEALKEEEMQL